MRLSDSSVVDDFPRDANTTDSDPILAVNSDIHGVLWAVSECKLNYLMRSRNASWKSVGFCSGSELETPAGLIVKGRELFLATEEHGVRVIKYNVSSTDPTTIVLERNVVWDSANLLSSDSISDIVIDNDLLYIATKDSGIDRFDLSTLSWLPSWSTSNWLSSDDINGLAVAPGWLYILGDQQVQPYDTEVLLFGSDIEMEDLGLTESGTSIIAWPGGLSRSPSDSLALVGDSSGKIGRILLDSPDGSFSLVSSPSIEDAEVTAIIDDGEAGDV